MGFTPAFKPDYVLFTKGWVVHIKPPFHDMVLTFLAQNRYEKVADIGEALVLKSPHVSFDPEADIKDWVQLPAPDAKLVLAYSRYLLDDSQYLPKPSPD